MTGWEMVKELSIHYKHLKFLPMTLTSRDQIEDKEKSKELNILYHLKKFNKSEIVNSINHVLGWSGAGSTARIEVASTVNDAQFLKQFCGFKVGNEIYAIAIMNVQEVVKSQFISSVPNSSIEVKGLINLRGQIVTSICLADVFKHNAQFNEDHMNIIVKNNDGFASLMVDEILDVMNFDEADRSLVPENVDPDLRKYFDSVYKKPNELITIVNVNVLLEDVL